MPNEYTLEPVQFTMPNGSIASGFAHVGPDVERIELRHLMSDGSYATEVLYRAVEQVPPAPVPAPPAPAPETATDAPT